MAKRNKRMIASGALAVISSTAFAADLPSRKSPPLDPILALLAVYALVPSRAVAKSRNSSKSSMDIQGLSVEGAPWAPKPNL